MKYTLTDIDSTDAKLLELCASHYRSCWRETYADRLTDIAMEALLEQSNSTEIRSWLSGEGNRVLTVVMRENQIVGSGACNCIANRCYVWGMYVRGQYQGLGVGGLLIEHFASKAEDRAALAMEVTVLTSSAKAVEFYKSAGFLEIGKSTYEISNGIELPSRILELVI